MRSAAVRGVLAGLAILLIGLAVLHRFGLAADALPRVPGQAPWLLARATGITAFVALSLDVALGLAMSTGTLAGWITRGHAVELHRWLSPIALALIAGHAGVLLVDGFIRFDLIDVLIPFASRYHPPAIGLGVVAAYLAVVVHASFALRKRLGTVTWRRLHYLSFVAFAAAAWHVVGGTDIFRPWAIAVVAPPVLAVLALIVHRLAIRSRAESSRRAVALTPEGDRHG